MNACAPQWHPPLYVSTAQPDVHPGSCVSSNTVAAATLSGVSSEGVGAGVAEDMVSVSVVGVVWCGVRCGQRI